MQNNKLFKVVLQVLANKSLHDINILDNVKAEAYDVYDKDYNLIISVNKYKLISYMNDFDNFMLHRSLPKNAVIPIGVKLPENINEPKPKYTRVK